MQAMMHLLLLLILYLPFQSVAHTIIVKRLTLGSIYNTSHWLQSPNGRFELGVVSPGASKSKYLGIRYTQIREKNIVWIANRNNPLIGDRHGGSFVLHEDGQLTFKNLANQTLWSSGTSHRNVSMAILFNTGNLVLQTPQEMNVWESFQHPGNIWLPNMKMDLNTTLTSWLSPDDPSEGPFSYNMLPTTELVIMWKKERQYWSSGRWDDMRFENVPEMSNSRFFNRSFHNCSLIWNPKNEVNFISQFILDIDGCIKLLSLPPSANEWSPLWVQPEVPCNVYAMCGSFGICQTISSLSTGICQTISPLCTCPLGFFPTNSHHWNSQVWLDGCKPSVPMDCKSSDEFTWLNHTFEGRFSRHMLPSNFYRCMEACRKNCSCSGFYFNPVEHNCTMYYGELINGRVSNDAPWTFYLRVASSSRKMVFGDGKKKHLVLIIVISIAFITLLLVTAILLTKYKTKKSYSPPLCLPDVLTMFPYKEIREGTNNFAQVIGSGGFGSVFKGTLPNGTVVAVKKLNWHCQGEKQFLTEVQTVGMIQHINLVRLLGFTFEGKHRLLLYEYMPNGSLDHWLFRRELTIQWASRYHIALGCARSLAYLHENCRHQIIHCDIKPENILLDAQFNAKVSDFGLAKILGKEFSRVMTTIRGTRGYLAPEWLEGMPLTTKVDVYSYGMMLFEIISGRRNIITLNDDTQVINKKGCKEKVTFYPTWAIDQMIKGNNILTLVDERIRENVDVNELYNASFVAGWCIQDKEQLRPSMKNVVDMLEGSLDVVGPPPIPDYLRSLELNDDGED